MVQQLEEHDDPDDGVLFRAVRDRLKKLAATREHKVARLKESLDAVDAAGTGGAQELLDRLVTVGVDELRGAPEAILRSLFDAFRLRVTYDAQTGTAVCRVVVSDDTLPGIHGAIAAVQSSHDAAVATRPVDGTAQAATVAHGRLMGRRGAGRADGRFPSVWRPRQEPGQTCAQEHHKP